MVFSLFIRFFIIRLLRTKYTNGNITILSNDCVGVIYHTLGLRFDSPTINLWLKDDDFLRFCLSLEEYLTAPLVEDLKLSSEYGYPVGRLEGSRSIALFLCTILVLLKCSLLGPDGRIEFIAISFA